MKKLFVFITLCLATAVFAQDVDNYIELLRSDLKTQKKIIITEAMVFTEQEAAAFWPVYRTYEADLDKLGDARFLLIKDYANNIDKLTDAKAKELMDKSIQFQKDRLDAKAKLFAELCKVLPVIKAMRLMQVENQMQLLLDLQISAELPLADKPQATKESKPGKEEKKK
jgi:hypothetical protein